MNGMNNLLPSASGSVMLPSSTHALLLESATRPKFVGCTLGTPLMFLLMDISNQWRSYAFPNRVCVCKHHESTRFFLELTHCMRY